MSTNDPIDLHRVKIDDGYRDSVFCLWSAALFFARRAGDLTKQAFAIEQLAAIGEAVH